MKLTKTQLKQIIKEELEATMEGDMYAQEGVGEFMASFHRRLQDIDNKQARSLMKSIRQLIQLDPAIQQQALEELTGVLARDSDPSQPSLDHYGYERDE